MFFMEEREEPSDGNRAEQLALRIDHGDIRVMPLDGQQRNGLGIRLGSDFQRTCPAQVVSSLIGWRRKQGLDRHPPKESGFLIDQIEMAGFVR